MAERIMSESDAMRMVSLVDAPRDRALLTLLYGGGLRISEACALRWRDLTIGPDMPSNSAAYATEHDGLLNHSRVRASSMADLFRVPWCT